jgi:hypothetical protein
MRGGELPAIFILLIGFCAPVKLPLAVIKVASRREDMWGVEF